jgi:uncharacterized protein (DUF58 family)
METASKSLDPAVLDRLEGLALVARTVVEGFMSGHHRSPLRGSSAEFAQHREYVFGDEIRRIDWKVFARNDRLVIKEFVEETTLDCHVLVDESESMAFGSLPWTKLDYARWCAAALTHLAISQRDTAGLVLFDREVRAKVPPGSGETQERAILAALEAAEPGGETGVGGILGYLAGRLRRRGIAAVFSDFFEDPERVLDGVRRLVHEPILFQVIDPLELSFEIDHLVRLDGFESTGAHKIDPKAIRAAYLAEIGAHNQLLAQSARALSVDFIQLDTSRSVEAALSTYLAHRMARARSGG